MEAPWIHACSGSRIRFTQLPPRLVRWGFHPSPIGPLLFGVDQDGALCKIGFVANGNKKKALEDAKRRWARAEFVRDDKATLSVAEKIFKKAAGVPLTLIGTKFQCDVWKRMLGIKPGTTLSYGELAASIKRPRAVRAVGTACGANPVPLIIPCHRVLATGGGLGGFGGGLPMKKRLLQAEGVQTI